MRKRLFYLGKSIGCDHGHMQLSLIWRQREEISCWHNKPFAPGGTRVRNKHTIANFQLMNILADCQNSPNSFAASSGRQCW